MGTPPGGSPLPVSATAAASSTPTSTPGAGSHGSPPLTTITVDEGAGEGGKKTGVRESGLAVGGGEVVVVSSGQQGRR